MRLTVEQIMTQIAATVNQEATAPSTGSAEYLLWLQYLNEAYREWAAAHDWEALRRIYYPTVVGTSVATVSLPLDFLKLAGPVKNNRYSEPQRNEVPYALREQTGLLNAEDNYVTMLGDISTGYSIIFNPATLSSGASVEIEYFALPTSLASSHEIPLVSDAQFLVDRTVAYIFRSRSDPRFQIVETNAREKLLSMIESSNAAKYNSYSNQTNLITPERKMRFRIGRN